MRSQISLPQVCNEAEFSEWRDEVSDRIKAHRARRRQADGGTLKLNFEADPIQDLYLDPHEELKRVRAERRNEVRAQQTESSQDLSHQTGEELEAEASPVPEPPICPELESRIPDSIDTEIQESYDEAVFSFSNIIEFPGRVLAARARRAAVAKSISPNPIEADAATQLRIFEADGDGDLMHATANPDAPIPPTGWAGLHLDDDKPAKAETSEFELPLQVAPMAKRASCMAADVVMVVLGYILFAIVEYCVTSRVPTGRNLAVFVAVPGLILWGIYHGLFLTLGRSTPGMRWVALGVCNFEDDHATRKQRIARVFAGLLSLVSLGMGYLWVFFDEDGIGWHDRMTRTYLREL